MASEREPIHLDGATLEGGGQLLRIALGLSALMKIPIHVTNIREENRGSKGGLANQHLACVEALARACDAGVTGAVKGSKEVVFRPGEGGGKRGQFYCLRQGSGREAQGKGEGKGDADEEAPAGGVKRGDADGEDYWTTTIDIGSAGHTALVLQAVLPFILFSPPKEEDGSVSKRLLHLTLKGGTNVSGGPSTDYVCQVLLPTLSRIGFPGFKMSAVQRGWASDSWNATGGFTLVIRPRLEEEPLPGFRIAPGSDTSDDRLNTSERNHLESPRDAQSSPSANPCKTRTNPDNRTIALHASIVAPTRLYSTFLDLLADNTILPTHFATLKLASPPKSAHSDELLCTTEFESTDAAKGTKIYFMLTATVTAPNRHPAGDILARDFLTRNERTHVLRHLLGEASQALAEDLKAGASADEFLRDQMVIFQALAEGKSLVAGPLWLGEDGGGEREEDLHAQTAEWVCERVLEGLGVQFDGQGGCQGVGFVERRNRVESADEPEKASVHDEEGVAREEGEESVRKKSNVR